MIIKVRFMLMAVLGVVLLAAPVRAGETSVLKTQKEKESYAVGVDLARNMKRQGVAAETDALARGVRDELSGEKLLMTEEDLHAALNAFQTELKLKRARTARAVAEDNMKEGEAFLTENKNKEGIVTLPSGLQYKVLREGNGRKPKETDKVEVNYRGTLIDGTEFDSSYRRGQPGTFEVAGMIPGWTEALKLMPVGSRWQVFIPSRLAYGEKGSGRKIGPNATIVFDMELMAIK